MKIIGVLIANEDLVRPIAQNLLKGAQPPADLRQQSEIFLNIADRFGAVPDKIGDMHQDIGAIFYDNGHFSPSLQAWDYGLRITKKFRAPTSDPGLH